MKQLFVYLGISLRSWWQFLYYNFFSKKVFRAKGHYLLPHRHVIIKVDNGSKIILNGSLLFGKPQVTGSKLESWIWLEENSTLEINGLCFIGADSYIRVIKDGKLSIGNCYINDNFQVTCAKDIHIGDNTIIARDVTVRSFDGHIIETPGFEMSKSISIGNHVWVGQGVSIMKGVCIEDDSILAAHSLVIKDVKSNTIVGGNPAKVIKTDVKWH